MRQGEPARNDGGEKGDLVKSPDLTSTQFALVPPAFFAPRPPVSMRRAMAGILALRDLTAISPRSHHDLTSTPWRLTVISPLAAEPPSTSLRSHRDQHRCQATDQQPQAEADQGGTHHGDNHIGFLRGLL